MPQEPELCTRVPTSLCSEGNVSINMAKRINTDTMQTLKIVLIWLFGDIYEKLFAVHHGWCKTKWATYIFFSSTGPANHILHYLPPFLNLSKINIDIAFRRVHWICLWRLLGNAAIYRARRLWVLSLWHSSQVLIFCYFLIVIVLFFSLLFWLGCRRLLW